MVKIKSKIFFKGNNWNNFIICKLQLNKVQLLLVVEITQLMIFAINLSQAKDVSLQVQCSTGKVTWQLYLRMMILKKLQNVLQNLVKQHEFVLIKLEYLFSNLQFSVTRVVQLLKKMNAQSAQFRLQVFKLHFYYIIMNTLKKQPNNGRWKCS